MKLTTIATALASMSTLTYAQQWRARLYERPECKGGDNVDVRRAVGSTLACTNIPNPPVAGDRSLEFRDDAPNNDRISVWTASSCTGAPATVYTGATGCIATLFPASPTGARSFSVNTP
ncbi:hypothetical protein PM082_012703 [Marasmius tenuissimus]|nr:hypothetical protein PM082_012703 [Marasmius tenuissimus]